MTSYDLVIAIRCHQSLDFILDTASSVLHCTSGRQTKLAIAVDGVPALAAQIRKHLPNALVHCSQSSWGWGIGLYGLLAETVLFCEEQITFSHFASIDYDTLFLAKGADDALLSLVDSPEIGLIGQVGTQNVRWKTEFERSRKFFEKNLGVPATYVPGEGVAGSMMLLTRSALARMKERGLFSPRWRNLKSECHLADDYLLPLLVKSCGLTIRDSKGVTECAWTATRDPCGLEKEGIKVFHPIKFVPGVHAPVRAREVKARNYFRTLRGQRPLK